MNTNEATNSKQNQQRRYNSNETKKFENHKEKFEGINKIQHQPSLEIKNSKVRRSKEKETTSCM
jgi:hypothetical protein